jgi:hypothetical protein
MNLCWYARRRCSGWYIDQDNCICANLGAVPDGQRAEYPRTCANIYIISDPGHSGLFAISAKGDALPYDYSIANHRLCMDYATDPAICELSVFSDFHSWRNGGIE